METNRVQQLSMSRAGRSICYVAPALTIYLPESPRRSLATAALEAYQRFCPADRRELVSGSRAPAFTPAAEAMGRRILESHLDRMDQRIDEAIAFWDGRETESWWFTIRGVPPLGDTKRASFCQVRFPSTVDSERIFELAMALAEILPFLSGHGGYSAVFSAERKILAFDQIFIWAKRYWGLEVEDLNLTLQHVLDRVKGANWLTFVGNALLPAEAENDAPVVTPAPPPPEVQMATTPHGRVFRAGPEPVLGDRNREEWPEGYAAMERFLSPLKLKDHGEFAGRFERERATTAWLNRLLQPDQW